jgi:hypothetical protein
MLKFGVSAFRQSGGSRVDYYKNVDYTKLGRRFSRAVQRELGWFQETLPDATIAVQPCDKLFSIIIADGVDVSHVIAGAMEQ